MKSWSALPKTRQMAEVLKVHKDPAYFASDYFLRNLQHIIVGRKAEIVRKFYRRGCTELDLIAGMRSGKSTLLDFFAGLETFYVLTIDYIKKYNLARGTSIMGVLCSSKEETAAEELYDPLVAFFEDSPFFQEQIYDAYRKVCIFPERNFRIRPIAANAATEAGKTSKFVCIDEFSKIQETESMRGAREIYRTFSKSVTSFKLDGHVFIAGSLKGSHDMSMELYRRGRASPRTLTPPMYPTWELNPKITREDLEDDFLKDPLGAARDFGCEPYSHELTYFRNPEIINFNKDRVNILAKINDGGEIQRPPYSFALAGDPALKHYAFGLALSHREGDKYICDGALRLKHGKEVDPREVRRVVMTTIDSVDVRWAVFDTWNFPETLDDIKRKGVPVINHVVKKEDYDFFKDRCWEDKAECVAYGPLEIEAKSVLLQGHKIAPPKEGSKDVMDAVVNSFWVLKEHAPQFEGFDMIRVIR